MEEYDTIKNEIEKLKMEQQYFLKEWSREIKNPFASRETIEYLDYMYQYNSKCITALELQLFSGVPYAVYRCPHCDKLQIFKWIKEYGYGDWQCLSCKKKL